eukprot:gene12766-biopygen3494
MSSTVRASVRACVPYHPSLPHADRSNPARRSSLASALTSPSPASLRLTGRGSPASLGEPWRALASLGEPLASLGEPKAHGEPWRTFLEIRDPNSRLCPMTKGKPKANANAQGRPEKVRNRGPESPEESGKVQKSPGKVRKSPERSGRSPEESGKVRERVRQNSRKVRKIPGFPETLILKGRPQVLASAAGCSAGQ